MAFAVDPLDPAARAHQKQASREYDHHRLESGELARSGLAMENGFFSSLPMREFRIVAVGGKRLKPPTRL